LQIREKIVTVTKIIEYAAHIYGEKAFSVHFFLTDTNLIKKYITSITLKGIKNKTAVLIPPGRITVFQAVLFRCTARTSF